MRTGTIHGKMDPEQAAAISAESCTEQIVAAMVKGRAEVFAGAATAGDAQDSGGLMGCLPSISYLFFDIINAFS